MVKIVFISIYPGSHPVPRRWHLAHLLQLLHLDHGFGCVLGGILGISIAIAGFGLLESGRVSSKDEVNIMVKNVVDVVFGGLSYWMFGFGKFNF